MSKEILTFKPDQPDPFFKSVIDKVYHDPWKGIDLRPTIIGKDEEGEFAKATWTLETTQIYVPKIVPLYLLPDYIIALPTQFPLWNALPKKAVEGPEIHYVRVTALGSGAAWRNEGWTPADGDQTNPTTARSQLPLCQAGASGKVSGLLQHTSRGFKDQVQVLSQIKTWDVLTTIETGACQGNGAAGPPIQPSGFITTQTVNSTNKNNAAVTLADIRTAIKQAWDSGGDLEGRGFAVTDSATYNSVKALLTEYLSYEPTTYHLPWGIKTFEVDGVPFLKSRGMPSATGGKAILFLDRTTNWAGVSLDVTYQDLGKTGDTIQFMILAYLNFVNQAPEFNAKIINIT